MPPKTPGKKPAKKPAKTSKQGAKYLAWLVVCELIELGLDEKVAVSLVGLPPDEFSRVVGSAAVGAEQDSEIAALAKGVLAARERAKTPPQRAIDLGNAYYAALAGAVKGDPYSLEFLLQYAKKYKGQSLYKRILHFRELREAARTPRELIELDRYCREIEHEHRAMVANKRARKKRANMAERIAELTQRSVDALFGVLSSGDYAEQRKAAGVALQHAIATQKNEKAAEVLLSMVLPLIQQFMVELVAITEPLIPEQDRQKWREKLQEKVIGLAKSIQSVEG